MTPVDHPAGGLFGWTAAAARFQHTREDAALNHLAANLVANQPDRIVRTSAALSSIGMVGSASSALVGKSAQ